MMFNVEANVMEGVLPSSPFPTPRASSVKCIPAVAEERETEWEAPVSLQNPSSKALHLGPVVIHPDLRQSTTALISARPIDGLLKGRKSLRIFTKPPLSPPFQAPDLFTMSR
jgi:hypothetical protein